MTTITINGSTPISELKTVDRLLHVLNEKGWRQAPTSKPDEVTKGSKPAEPIDGPYWEYWSPIGYEKFGITCIYMHPGVHYHGSVFAEVTFFDKEFKSLHFSHYNEHSARPNAEEVCIDDLKSLLEVFQAEADETEDF